MPSLNDWIFGSEDKLKKVPTGTGQQRQFGNDIISWLQNMMQGGGFDLANQYDQRLLGQGPEAFNQFASPYLQQFEEQILPQIAERFAGGGALSSSGFGQALGGASAGLQSQLAQLFSDLQNQAANRQSGQFQNISQLGLNYSPYDYVKQQGSQGFLGNFVGGLGQGAGSSLLNAGINSLFKNSSGGIK